MSKSGESGRPRRPYGAGLVRPLVAALAGYAPGEQPSDPSVVKLNTNENPYPPSPRVRAALAEACERLQLYPDPSAGELRARAGSLYGVDPEGVVVGNGSDELLALLLRATVGPGDAVAYPVPTYSLYETQVALQGGTSVTPAFEPDWSLPGSLSEVKAKLVIVCNPNAPSGSALSTAALEGLVAARQDCVVVIDEAYADFADENALSLVGRYRHVVVLRTLSKSYSLAGLRVGFALTNPDLAAELAKVKDSYNVGRLAQAGALAALDDQATMQDHVARVRSTRARLESELLRLGFAVVPSKANFVLARRPGESLAPVASDLRARGILVRYFESLPDAVRISVGTDEQIDRLLAALREIVAR
jgi:histidinol-phosphate aminotransferase